MTRALWQGDVWVIRLGGTVRGIVSKVFNNTDNNDLVLTVAVCGCVVEWRKMNRKRVV